MLAQLDRDADSLVRLFLYLGFYTNRYDDLKGTEMHRRLQVRGMSPHHLFFLPSHSPCLPPSLDQDVADLDHSEFDCLMVAVLTHGINGKLYSTDGELIAVEEVTK